MAILLEHGEVVSQPPDGKSYLKLDDSGAASLVASDGTETPIGSGVLESITGDGVDNTDPANPVVDLTGVIDTAMFAAGAEAPLATAPGDAAAFTAELNPATNTLPGLMLASAKASDKRTSAAVLTDANATIQPFTDACSRYILPAGTLTANRVLTLGITGAIPGRVCEIVILDTSAATYTINNNAGAPIAAKGISDPAQTFQVYLNGADWVASTSWYSGT